MATIEQIKAKLLEKKNKSGGQQKTRSSGGDNASFPFWNIPNDTSATIRFLPDGDPTNDFFWVERQVIKLPFNGVVGGEYPTDKPVLVTVPCVDMFGMTCPIIAATKSWWKDDDKKDLARTYYKKKSWIFQGFKVSSPIEEENPPENPIRRFVLGKSLYEMVEKALTDDEMEDMPTDYTGGTDFKIAKTKKGEYSNYGGSSWSRKSRSLNEAELAAIEKFGLFDLKASLGRKPDADEMVAIVELFEASLAGEPFDADKYGKYYRAYTDRENSDELPAVARKAAESNDSVTEKAPEKVATKVTEAAEAEVETTVASPAKSTSDIMARLKARTAK